MVKNFSDIRMLRNMGYEVEQKTPWHYTVSSENTLINLWPTKRKWMIAFAGGASFYQNADHLRKIVMNTIGAPGEQKGRDPKWLLRKVQKEVEAAITPEMREAEWEWRNHLSWVYDQIAIRVAARGFPPSVW